MPIKMACPHCGSADNLKTIEAIEGLAACVVVKDDKGELDYVYEGYTEVLWDTSTSTGIHCGGCDWESEGDAFADALVPFTGITGEPPYLCPFCEEFESDDEDEMRFHFRDCEKAEGFNPS